MNEPPKDDTPPVKETWRCQHCGKQGNLTHHEYCAKCGENQPPRPKPKRQ